MKPFVADSDFTLYVGDVRECLRELPDESVHTVVTSPPYWGLRDYGTGQWEGGDADCDHLDPAWQQRVASSPKQQTNDGSYARQHTGTCGKCGATRVDQQLGLEPTPDDFVAAMVDVFREVWRVLRSDGTLWLNLGDSYAGGGGFAPDAPINQLRAEAGSGMDGNFKFSQRVQDRQPAGKPKGIKTPGLKPKDLVGIPWRVAFALQADGWYLRSDIIWSKPNPMSESVTDRPTKAHEYVFLLTKSPRYFFDQEAVREPHTPDGRKVSTRTVSNGSHDNYQEFGHEEGRERWPNGGRNVRSVWELATQPYPEAHFATFPEALPERCIKAGTSERGCCPECGAPWEREVEKEYPVVRQPREAMVSKGKPHASGIYDGLDGHSGTVGADGRSKIANVTTTGWAPSCECGDVLHGAVHGEVAGGGMTTLPERGSECRGEVSSGSDNPTRRRSGGERQGGQPRSESVECDCPPGWKHDPVKRGNPVPCTVLDPFMGSGTTALVARRLGRRSIGVELNPEYAALCARRLQQLSLFGGDPEPAPSAPVSRPRGLTGGAYSPPGQSPHSNARPHKEV